MSDALRGEQALRALTESVVWNEQGLAPAIAQDAATGEVLMLAWMNRQSLAATLREGRVHYWSRSRGRIWKKGERSGHEQLLREIRLDCDGDALLLRIEQRGGIACHTGRRSCFFRRAEEGGWIVVEAVVTPPEQIYGGE